MIARSVCPEVRGTWDASPVIAPQVAIGALGRIQKLPRFDDDDNVITARVMQVSWAADHKSSTVSS